MGQEHQGAKHAEASGGSLVIQADGSVFVHGVTLTGPHPPVSPRLVPAPGRSRKWVRPATAGAMAVAAVVAVGAASVFWPVEWQVTRAFSPRGAVPLPVPSTTTTTTVPSTAPQSAVQPEVQPFRTAGAGPPTTTSAPAVLPDPTSAAPQLPPQAPQPRIVIAVGEPTSSSNCERGKCFWIDARLTGFAPNTRYDVIAMGNERDFSEPCRSVTDANGADQCGDTRYDVPGAKVYVYVTTPQGKVFSNTITWPSG